MRSRVRRGAEARRSRSSTPPPERVRNTRSPKKRLRRPRSTITGHNERAGASALQNNELMEAFRDRTIKVDIPYNLAQADEVRIYRRQFRATDLRASSIAPHTLEIAAFRRS
ncbi:MAG: hypothetical protein R3F34_18900 [Planctomycetota bacterium]